MSVPQHDPQATAAVVGVLCFIGWTLVGVVGAAAWRYMKATMVLTRECKELLDELWALEQENRAATAEVEAGQREIQNLAGTMRWYKHRLDEHERKGRP